MSWGLGFTRQGVAEKLRLAAYSVNGEACTERFWCERLGLDLIDEALM